MQKLCLNDAIVKAFIEDVLAYALLLEDVPSVFSHPIDAKDSIYVNVAVAAGASVITTRDFHLLNWRKPNRPEGVKFLAQFPTLEIMTPPELLRRMEKT